MDKDFQKEFRERLFKKYQEHGFEALALYKYHGERFEKIKKQMDEYSARVTEIKDKISGYEAENTKDAREKVKALRVDLVRYQDIIKSVGPNYNKMMDQAQAFRRDGLEYLEEAEAIKAFSLKTLEEIADAEKQKEAAPPSPPEAISPTL